MNIDFTEAQEVLAEKLAHLNKEQNRDEGPRAPVVAGTANVIGRIYELQGERESSHQYFSIAIRAYNELFQSLFFEEKSPSERGTEFMHYAVLLWLSDNKQSIDYFQMALGEFEKCFNSTNPRIEMWCRWLAAFPLVFLGRYSLALDALIYFEKHRATYDQKVEICDLSKQVIVSLLSKDKDRLAEALVYAQNYARENSCSYFSANPLLFSYLTELARRELLKWTVNPK